MASQDLLLSFDDQEVDAELEKLFAGAREAWDLPIPVEPMAGPSAIVAPKDAVSATTIPKSDILTTAETKSAVPSSRRSEVNRQETMAANAAPIDVLTVAGHSDNLQSSGAPSSGELRPRKSAPDQETKNNTTANDMNLENALVSQLSPAIDRWLDSNHRRLMQMLLEHKVKQLIRRYELG